MRKQHLWGGRGGVGLEILAALGLFLQSIDEICQRVGITFLSFRERPTPMELELQLQEMLGMLCMPRGAAWIQEFHARVAEFWILLRLACWSY